MPKLSDRHQLHAILKHCAAALIMTTTLDGVAWYSPELIDCASLESGSSCVCFVTKK